jgi:hypothetical protein
MEFLFISLDLIELFKNESAFSKCLMWSRSNMVVYSQKRCLAGITAIIPSLMLTGDEISFHFIEFDRVMSK